MKFHFFGLTITITNKAIIAFAALAISFVFLTPSNTEELYSDYSIGLGLVFAVLCGLAGLFFVKVEGEPI